MAKIPTEIAVLYTQASVDKVQCRNQDATIRHR
jgi:hypothetical protein